MCLIICFAHKYPRAFATPILFLGYCAALQLSRGSSYPSLHTCYWLFLCFPSLISASLTLVLYMRLFCTCAYVLVLYMCLFLSQAARQLSGDELERLRQKRLTSMKNKIAEIAESVIEEPEKKVREGERRTERKRAEKREEKAWRKSQWEGVQKRQRKTVRTVCEKEELC